MKTFISTLIIIGLFNCAFSIAQGTATSSNTSNYQIQEPYDGMRGDINCVITTDYYAWEEDGEVYKDARIMEEIRYFDVKGYIFSHQRTLYFGHSAPLIETMFFIRDKQSLVASTTTFGVESGTSVSNLTSRKNNEEIWETISQRSSTDMEKKTTISRFTKDRISSYNVVGGDNKLEIEATLKFSANRKIVEAIGYDNGRTTHTYIQYNANGLISKQSSDTSDEIKTYEYEYDKFKNPLVKKHYSNGELDGITEYEIHYRKGRSHWK